MGAGARGRKQGTGGEATKLDAKGFEIAVGIPLTWYPPRADPDGRSLAHPVLIADDWRQSERRDRDGGHAV
jgi:hypothetical protein